MKVQTILYLRCDSIGDHVLSACMLEPLRRAAPAARLIALVPDSVASIYERCPFISELVGISFRSFSNLEFRDKMVRQIQAYKADLCLNPAYSRTELGDFLVFGSQATARIGHRGDVSRIRPDRLARADSGYTHLIPNEQPWKSELARHADFLNGIGVRFDFRALGPKIWTSPADEEFADKFFHGFDRSQTVALFAGAQLGVRKYSHYGKAIAAECKKRNLNIVALGGADDSAVNLANLKDAGVAGVNLSGQTTLRQAAAILRRCRLAIGAETGLAHIACAVGTPQVVLLGGGHFGRFMPYSQLTTIACLPLDCFGCDWECKFDRVHCTWDVDPSVLNAAFVHALDHPQVDRPQVFCEDKFAWSQTSLSLGNLPQLASVSSKIPPKWSWPAKLTRGIGMDIYQVNRAGEIQKMN